jgi:hypothetical protein
LIGFTVESKEAGGADTVVAIGAEIVASSPAETRTTDTVIHRDLAEFSCPTNWTGAAIVWASIDTNAAILAQVVCALIDRDFAKGSPKTRVADASG